MGKNGWAIVAFTAALVIGFFSWEWYLSPEARVKGILNAAADAAVAADAEGFVSFLTSDYSDYRHVDRGALETSFATAFERVDRLKVTIQSAKVEVDAAGAEAIVRFDLIVVAIKGEERYIVVGTPFQPDKVVATMRREADGWKIARIEQGGY